MPYDEIVHESYQWNINCSVVIQLVSSLAKKINNLLYDVRPNLR